VNQHSAKTSLNRSNCDTDAGWPWQSLVSKKWPGHCIPFVKKSVSRVLHSVESVNQRWTFGNVAMAHTVRQVSSDVIRDLSQGQSNLT